MSVPLWQGIPRSSNLDFPSTEVLTTENTESLPSCTGRTEVSGEFPASALLVGSADPPQLQVLAFFLPWNNRGGPTPAFRRQYSA